MTKYFKWSRHATAQPNSKSPLERKLSESQIYPIAHPIRHLWRWDTCPAHLLPYLAWSLSVDFWRDEWPEAVKRRVIKNAYKTHKFKGTIVALKAAIEPFGLSVKVTEWWQKTPRGKRASFELDLFSESAAITQDDFAELIRIINEVKPVSRHLGRLGIGFITRGRLKAGAVVYHGSQITIYPFLKPEIEIPAAARAAAGLQQIDLITITPKETHEQ